MTNNNLIKILLLITALTFGSSCFANDSSEKWDLKSCLSYGLQNHPRLKIAESSVESEKAKIDQTGAAYDVNVDARAGWTHRKQDSSLGTTAVSDPVTDSTSESLSVSKLLFDSGKTSSRVKAAKQSLKAAQEQKFGTVVEIAALIKEAFFKAQQAKALLNVQQETLDGYLTHLEKVKGYVEVGTRPPYDITRAKVDVANARVSLISAKSTLKQNLVLLAKSIGKEGTIEIQDFELNQLPQKIDQEREDLLSEALSRPDLKAAQFQVKALDYSLAESKKSLKPSLSANGDYNWSGTNTPLNRNWTVGVNLNWPLLDGKLTRSKIRIAKSQLNSSKATYDNLKLTVYSELENSITEFEDSLERYEATNVLVQQASESKELAEGRYDSGLGSPIEITDARVEYSKARGNYFVAYFDSLIALARLEKVLGRLPTEIQKLDTLEANTDDESQKVEVLIEDLDKTTLENK
jgi:outer membrane protein TolC